MEHAHATTKSEAGDLKVAFLLNLGFAVAEILGGLAINSMAVVSDALHDLGDSLSLAVGRFLARYSAKETDARFSYGYRRFSLLGAIINATILVAGSLFILAEAIPRLSSPEPFDAAGMILFALAGLIVNGLAAWRLRRGATANSEVISLHLLEDVMGWAAVLLVGLVSLVVDIPILDPILSILITLFVLVSVISRFRAVVALFLQGVPEGVSLSHISSRLNAVRGVIAAHHVHLWSLDGEHNVLTAHLVVAAKTSVTEAIRIKAESKAVLQQLGLHLEHITLEVEYAEADCSIRQGGASPRN